METRSSDLPSPIKPSRRNRSDLIDLSQDSEDSRSSNNLLDLFDPLSHSLDPKQHQTGNEQANQFNRARPSNRSAQPIELKRKDRRFRATSACPKPRQSGSFKYENDEARHIKLYITSDGSTVSHSSKATQNSDSASITDNTSSSLNDDNELTKELNKLSFRSNSARSLSCSGDITSSNSDLKNATVERKFNQRADIAGASGQPLPIVSNDENKLKLLRKHQRSSHELTLLTKKVKSFRIKYKHYDTKTNSGLVSSPTLYSSKVRDMSVKIIITSPMALAPINFTCNVSTTIEHLISNAVILMFEDLKEGDSTENYMLKVTGKEEYFDSQKCLADYALVSHCWKFDLDVQLTLIRIDSVKRPFQRGSKDDFHCNSLLCADDLLSKTTMSRYSHLNYEALNIIIETFDREAQRLYADVTNKSTYLQTQSLLQTTKAICSHLMSCETGQLSESKDNLAKLCQSFKEEGDQLSNEDRYKMIEVIQHAIKRLVSNMRRLLNLASASLPVDYEVEDVATSANLVARNSFVDMPIDIVKDQVTVRIQVIAQLKPDWLGKYSEFHIKIFVMHGEVELSKAISSIVKPDVSFFPRLLFDEELTLSINYSHLPREARLVLILVGTDTQPLNSNQLSVSNFPEEDNGAGFPIRRSNSATSIRSTAPMYTSSPRNSQMINPNQKLQLSEPIDTPLATAIKYFFDSQLNLMQGDQLLSMHTITEESEEKIYTETIADKEEPVIVVEFKKFPPEKRIFFPSDILNQSDSTSDRQSSLKVFDIDHLDPGANFVIEKVINEKQCYEGLEDDEKTLLWEHRLYLTKIPAALPKVLLSVPSWSCNNLKHIYELLNSWTPMMAIDALQLLLPSFPDFRIREVAVEWISKQQDDELCDYLPQLVQAFRYEKNIDCPLFWLLLDRALKNVRIANLLYWQLKLNTTDRLFQDRSETLINCLLWTSGSAFWKAIDKQEDLLSKLTEVSNEIKRKRDSQRMNILQRKLEIIQDHLMEKKPTLPYALSLEVCDLELKSCSYFPSNTLPLKLAFRSCEESCNRQPRFHAHDSIFKMGDDLRQDMLAIQMIRIMEKLWLREGLDLRMVTFDCIATGDRQGMVEMVQNAETLRKIQQNSGFLAGTFNSRAIDEYIRLWNTSELEYKTALDKFLHSCAGYSVATYILGICDRHNDNIMITNSGHLFHIDFGKFLGDAQMMGSIKRDRTPFVLTADMAYVINGGDRPSKKFQTFVELCTMGFNIIRRHRNLFLNLFSLMSSAKIHGLNSDSVKYIDKMLMPNLTEAQAMAQFTRLIEECLNSRSTQVNFFIHNLAQLRFSNDNSKQTLLSFIPKTFTIHTSGRIESLDLVHLYKKYEPEKQYYYVVRVKRYNQPDAHNITRTFREFSELQMKLNQMFKSTMIHDINRSSSSFLMDFVGRNNTKEVAERRCMELKVFLKKLLLLPPEISQCDLIYTFFHPILRDQATYSMEASILNDSSSSTFGSQEYSEAQRNALYLGSNGQVKLSLSYKNSSLSIMVMHAKNLMCPENSNGPNCYAKIYLLPDPNKQSKRKTRIVRQSCHPVFMELIVYQLPLESIKSLTLQVSLWHSEAMQPKGFMGAALIPLSKVDLSKDTTDWFPLRNF